MSVMWDQQGSDVTNLHCYIMQEVTNLYKVLPKTQFGAVKKNGFQVDCDTGILGIGFGAWTLSKCNCGTSNRSINRSTYRVINSFRSCKSHNVYTVLLSVSYRLL